MLRILKERKRESGRSRWNREKNEEKHGRKMTRYYRYKGR
jgi:hypothetical protein